ncbi:MAG: 3-methyl-2-oxobutanoate hydroxymethyltransferase [Acidimicrobiales bacterium]|nr:3-methyl-2-oxobutanoate hydroxymethyltransferase [Acidimicrobiales bacterium]MDG2216691.1 3-methyl-2-oxobutanoate hydroxymethyltransferase [Acidimicrobiales bacterium]
MTRILDYNGQEADRTVTVADIVKLHGSGQQYAQVTASTAEEAAACEAAGIEMVVCMSDCVPALRQGSSRVFITSAIDFTGAITADDLLGVALESLEKGADAVITARRLEVVELLATEAIPVMGHLGFVPKKSNLFGGVRGVGKTAAEAGWLWGHFRRLEDAGAFAVECELISAAVMTEIHHRTRMSTISLGSGPTADVTFLFSSDICGESEHVPRHARRYGDLARLHQQIRDERVEALTAFRADVTARSFPDESEVVAIAADELAQFVDRLQP